MLQINQIVKGRFAGTFVVLGFRTIGQVEHAQLKEVHPQDYTRTMPGEIALPIDCLVEVGDIRSDFQTV